MTIRTKAYFDALSGVGVVTETVFDDLTHSTPLFVEATTAAVLIAAGTTGQQPGTPANGHVRVNTTTDALEWYSSAAWRACPVAWEESSTVWRPAVTNTHDLGDSTHFVRSGYFGTALVMGAVSTSGIRLDLESGVLAIREGDDSAYANAAAMTVEASTTLALRATPFSGDVIVYANTNLPGSGATGVNFQAGGIIGWASSTNAASAADTTVSRYAAGVVGFPGTGAIRLPVGTEAQRPGSPAAGMLRLNSDSDEIEWYNGTSWESSTENWEESGTVFRPTTDNANDLGDATHMVRDVYIGRDIEINGALNHDGTTAGFYGVAPVTRSTGWTITNDVTDRTFDANADSTLELADIVATLIRDLAATGIIGAVA